MDYVKQFVREKQLEGHHIEHELQVYGLAVDSQVKDNASFINTEACEILCRRIYGIRRAFSLVKGRADWQQPRGQGANKWKSKVQWGLLDEIDMRSLKQDTGTIEPVEADLRKQLEKKALLNKWMTKGLGQGEVPGEAQCFRSFFARR